MTRFADECRRQAKASAFIYLAVSLHALPLTTAASSAAPTPAWEHDAHGLHGQSDAPLHEDVSPFEPAVPAVEMLETPSPSRNLQDEFEVIVEPGWEFPPGTKLTLGSPLGSTVFGSGYAAALAINIMAGFRYYSVAIAGSPGAQFGVTHNGATIKLVDASVKREECHTTKYDVGMMSSLVSQRSGIIGPSPLSMGATLRLMIGSSLNDLSKDTSTPHLVFMRGGQYKLCYTPDGTFLGDEWRNAVVPVQINVYGVSSQCNTNDCLAAERWECYFSYRAEAQGPCIFDFTIKGRVGWSVNGATASKFSWSKAWPSDNFVADLTFPEKCSDSITGEYIAPESQRIEPQSTVGISVDAQTPASMPQLVPSEALDSFTVSACYCPNFDGQVAAGPEACVDTSEYIQPFGAVYYWMARICSLQNYESCGVIGYPYMRIVPEQPFVLRIQCPPGRSCAGATNNRIKFLDLPDSNYEYLPSWDPKNRCSNRKVSESTAWMWAPQGSALNDLPLDGGTRRDYKVWADRHLIFTLTFGQALDVCYCENNCEDGITNYFQVGRLQTAESLGVARWSKSMATYVPGGMELPPMETIRYLGKPGTVNLFGGVMSPITAGMLPADSVPFAKRVFVKLMSFDRERLYPGPSTLEQHVGLDRARGPNAQQQLDAACAAASYRSELNTGPTSPIQAKEFQAYIAENSESQYLSFSGIEQDQPFYVLQAGTVSICYCALISDADRCQEDRFWLHAAMFMVYGPLGTQRLEFPVNLVVDMEFEGWGFDNSNSIRFINLAQTCRENGHNPGGSRAFRVDCPAIDGAGCRLPDIMESLHTFVDTGNSTGVWISDLEINEENTTLIFTDDVAHLLDDGDAITISPDSVLLSGRSSNSWAADERYNIAKLTGVYEYADDPEEFRYLWKRVSHVYKPGGGVMEPNKLSLPVGWPMGQIPAITFLNNRGVWIRRNKLRTRREFVAPEPAGMKVCFAVNDGGLQKHYSEAGTVFFVNPTAMDDAGVRMTTQVVGSVGPVVVVFSPIRNNPSYNLNHDAPLVLRILWQDMSGKLEPLVSYQNYTSGTVDSLPADSEVAQDNATQTLCGLMFLEMWTNDANGFPLPRGCYYSRTFQNQPDSPGDITPTYREYFIVFEPNNGLKSLCNDGRFRRRGSCSYMLVLNARVGTIKNTKTEVATLHTKCADEVLGPGEKPKCGSKHTVFEWGAGYANKITMPPNNESAQLKYVEVGPIDSLREGNMPSLWELDGPYNEILGGYPWDIEVRAWVKDRKEPIRRSSWLRFFFTPLGVWDIGYTDCSAVCIPPENFTCSDGRGGAIVTCRKVPVTLSLFDGVVRMPRNVVELQYPRRMDELNASNYNLTDDEHVLQIRNLQMPSQGFFPQQFLAQLNDQFDSNPSVALTNNSFLRLSIPETTTGRLLIDGQIGSGEKPFVGDRSNRLFVYMHLGVTVRHDTSSESAPMIEIILPPGYTCLITGDGSPDPDGTMKLFKLDRDNDKYFDYFKGSLKMGRWDSEGGVCFYKLAPSAALFVGTQFYVQIEVHNPLSSLARTDPQNVWFIQVKGMNGTIYGSQERFISLQDEAQYPEWVGNLAVIEPLDGECMQPSNFIVGATQELTIFFKAVHTMPVRSLLYFDAPTGFDFGDECTVGDSPDETYADWLALPWGDDSVGERSKTRRLGGVDGCLGDVWGLDPFEPPPTANFTRAKIQLTGNLLSDAYYAFTIKVRNAYDYLVDQQNGWTLWVMSPEGYPVDGSRYTLQFNQARIATAPIDYYDRTWGLYEAGLRMPTQMDFGSPSVLPTPDMRITQFVVIYPLQTRRNTFVNLRILAPVGYIWDVFREEGLLGEVPGVTCERCKLLISETPRVNYYNELCLDQLVFRGGYVYGIRARIYIPSRPPTRSSNAFYIEMNYDKVIDEQRLQASKLPAPKLRVLYNAFIFSVCNAANAANIIEFHMTTVSALYAKQGFVFRGDEATAGLVLLCFPHAARDTMAIPRDIQCSIFPDPLTYLPVVILSASKTMLAGGHWGFTFRHSRNVPNAVAGGYWILGTYSNVDQYPNIELVDQSVRVPAPGTLNPMVMAGYFSPPEWEAVEIGRQDQPGIMNSIIFYFQLSSALVVPPGFSTITLALRGPRGFKFLENCLSGVEVLNGTDGTFMNETNETWPCRHNLTNVSWCPTLIEDWPDEMVVDSCLGLDNTAKILIANQGLLQAGVSYGIKVSMINPSSGNTSDMWALDIGGEASNPIPAFQVRTFDVDQTFLFAASPAVTLPTAIVDSGMPISLTFTPSVHVPAAMAGARRLQLSTLPQDMISEDFWYYYPKDAVEGAMVLTAPADFEFSVAFASIDSSCAHPELGVLNRNPLDDETVFHQTKDMYCTVPNANQTRIRFIGKKALQAFVSYRLVLYLKNPLTPRTFEPWILTTEKTKWLTLQTIQLDRIVLPGYEVSVSFPTWKIDNLSLEYKGEFKVRRIKFDILFNTDVLDGDTFTIIAPAGFSMIEGLGTNSSCMNFEYATVLLPLLDTPPPTCSQDTTGESKLVFTINEGRPNGIALEAERPLSFIVGAVNPVSTPDIVRNTWRAYHRRDPSTDTSNTLASDTQSSSDVYISGNLLGVGVTTSWNIISPLYNVSVFISGIYSRAGSTSNITIEFTPTVWSTVMELVIHTPAGFSFYDAQVSHPYLIDEQTGGDRLVVSNGSFMPYQPVSITVFHVRLGIAGGATRMDFRTFETNRLADPVGGRLNYILGFRLPGALTVFDQYLLSQPVILHFEQNQTDAVLPLLPTRVGELARVELTFTITMPVGVGGQVILSSVTEGDDQFMGLVDEEDHRPSLAKCSSPPLTGPDAVAYSKCNATYDINVTSVELVKDRMSRYPHMIILNIEHRSENPQAGITTPPPDTPVLPTGEYISMGWQSVLTPIVYRLRVWCYPSSDVSMWRVETKDGGPMASNTNDAATSAIHAVQPMGITVDAIRTPPASMVPATLEVQPGPYPANISMLQVVLPLLYTEHLAPELVTFKSTGRVIATIDLSPSQQDTIASDGVTLEPRVVTPGATGEDPRWFLLGYTWDPSIAVDDRSMSNADMVSWGYSPGWTINQLNVTIAYASIAAFIGFASLYFSVPIKAKGTTAVITSPLGFTIACPDPAPGLEAWPCTSVPYRRIMHPEIHSTVNLTLTGASVEGAFLVYSFVMKIQTPIHTPESVTWDVRVYDSNSSIVDAAIGVQKPDFVPDMFVTAPSFSWNNPPVAGEMAFVTCQISMTRRVRHIKAVLISLPEGYRHDIVHPNQFKSLSKKFPAAIDVEWRNYDNLRWLRILVAKPASEELDFIPGGTYHFEFPVMVPITPPLATEWYFALCSSYACESIDPPDEHVIVYFPMPMTAVVAPEIDYTPKAISGTRLKASQDPALRVLIAVACLLRVTCLT